ncbi:MAG: glycosyltransferase family 2 protein [Bacteroidota bacterium]|nr:glycosyltransferase family 2 protein [Bacteroidota bacterium]
MIPLSVIVITKNEAHNIAECLETVRWADDIIVVDAESRDETVAKAQLFTPKVFIKPWLGFAAAKQFAFQQTRHQWILWLDADERVTPELAKEIQQLIALQPTQAAFSIARRAYFLGRWIKHSGWYPGYVPRLFHKERASFNSASVHEGLEICGEVSRLKNDLLHFTDPNIYHYFAKLNRYTTLAADELYQKGKEGKLSDVIIRPVWQFVRMYILKLGFLDGIPGLLLASFSSGYVFTKYSKLLEKQLVTNQK